MKIVNICHIALGANLPSATGAPLDTLSKALKFLERESAYPTALSAWYETPAFPIGSGPDYINGVVKVKTELTALELLAVIGGIEEKLGRVRENRWDARVCDLDILAFNDAVMPSKKVQSYWRKLPLDKQRDLTPEELILPHPRLQDRAFVLVPFADLDPNWQHPVTGLNVLQMIAALNPEDLCEIRKIKTFG